METDEDEDVTFEVLKARLIGIFKHGRVIGPCLQSLTRMPLQPLHISNLSIGKLQF